jgi:hypothetical protein
MVETKFEQPNKTALLLAVSRPSDWPGPAEDVAGTQTGTHSGSDDNQKENSEDRQGA